LQYGSFLRNFCFSLHEKEIFFFFVFIVHLIEAKKRARGSAYIVGLDFSPVQGIVCSAGF
ncbi:hypothetical protein, partial [Flavobacterium sp. VMW]|uniref:hypothetical protein n=1 Tax=Flavobacterium sp. VMW TaxID=1699134 RepID=UPI001A94F268